MLPVFLVIYHSQVTGAEDSGREYASLDAARRVAEQLINKPIYFDGEQIATVESAWVQDRDGNTY
jgi:hypothetical protein